MATIAFGDKKGAEKSGAPAGEVTTPASVEDGTLTREGSGQPPTGSEVATRPDGTLANPTKSGFVGAWTMKFVRLPRLNLIHKTSKEELITAFGIGSFAFNKEVKMSDGKTPIVLTVLRAALDWQQKLPFGDKETPTTFDTEEEVIKAGGSLNYKDVKSGNYYGPRAHLQLTTTPPEGASEDALALFPYTFDGSPYGMAMLTVASSAFTSVGKELATLCTNNKVGRKGMEFMRLELTSESRKNSANEWRIPVIKYTGENPAGLVAFYMSLL